MRFGKLFLTAALVVAASGVASAQTPHGTPETQAIELTVDAVDDFTVSEATVAFSVIPNNVQQSTTNEGGTYDLTTNAAEGATTTRRVQVAITLGGAFPPGVAGVVDLEAPGEGGNGASAGNVTLTTTPTDVLTGVFATAVTGRTIIYRFTVAPTVAAQQIDRTVTFTIVSTD